MPLSEEPGEPRAIPDPPVRAASADAGTDGGPSGDVGGSPDGAGATLRAGSSAQAAGDPSSGAPSTPTGPAAMSRMSIASFARSHAPAFVSSPSSPFVAPPDPASDDGADVAETGGTGETGGAGSGAASASSEPVVFACEGGPSSVRLRIDVGGRAAATGLDLASIAADAEAAIGGIERWFDVPLDLSPVPDGVPGANEPAVRATLAPRTPGSLPATLHLPPAALVTLPPLPRALELSLRMRFEPFRTRCRVARVVLPAAQAARLLPGAVLLLPESFGEGAWTVRLEVGDEALAATLDIPAAALVIAAGTAFAGTATARGAIDGAVRGGREDGAEAGRQEAGGTVRIDIVLERAVELDPRTLLGGGGASVDLPAQLPYCGFRCLVDGVPRLDGHVAPLGDGHAFFALESIG